MAVTKTFFEFIDVRDRFGTPVWQLGVHLRSSIWDGNSQWSWFTDFIVAIVQIVGGYGVWLLDLVVGNETIVGIIGDGAQSVLDTVYRVVNPMIIAMVALIILLGRLYVGEMAVPKGPNGAPKPNAKAKFEFRKTSVIEDAGFRKKVVDQGSQVLLLLILIGYFMANPFLIVQFLISLGNDLMAAVVQAMSGADSVGSSPLVDGLYVPLVQMINYGEPLSPECTQEWSQTWASGGDVSELGCLTSDQAAFAEASVWSVITAVVGAAMMVAFFRFAFVAFKKTSFYTAKAMYLSALIPWRAAKLLAYPGTERERLDKVYQAFKDCVVTWLWMLGAILLAMCGPVLVTGIASAIIKAGFPTFIAMVGMCLIYWFGAKLMDEAYGKRLVANPDRKWFPFKVDPDDASVTSWSMAWQEANNHPLTGKAKAQWEKIDRLHDFDAAAADEAAAQAQGEEHTAMNVSEADREIIDQAMGDGGTTPVVNTESMPTVPLLVDIANGAPALPPGGVRLSGDGDDPLNGTTAYGPGRGGPTPMGGGGTVIDMTKGAAAGEASPVTFVTSIRQWNEYVANQQRSTSNSAVWVASEQVAGQADGTAVVGEIVDGHLTGTGAGAAETAVSEAGVAAARIVDGEVVDASAVESAGTSARQRYRQQLEQIAADEGASLPGDGQSGVFSDAVGAAGMESLVAGVALTDVAEEVLRDHHFGVVDSDQAAPAGAGSTGTGTGSPLVEGLLGQDSVAAEFKNAQMVAKTLGIVLEPMVRSGKKLWFEEDANGQPTIRFGDGQGFGDDL